MKNWCLYLLIVTIFSDLSYYRPTTDLGQKNHARYSPLGDLSKNDLRLGDLPENDLPLEDLLRSDLSKSDPHNLETKYDKILEHLSTIIKNQKNVESRLQSLEESSEQIRQENGNLHSWLEIQFFYGTNINIRPTYSPGKVNLLFSTTKDRHFT